MNDKSARLIRQLSQKFGLFIILGMMIAFALAIFIFFYYVMIWGIIIGSVLWLISLVRDKLFHAATGSSVKKTGKEKRPGRIIDQ
jgi:hypothetical protein